MPYPLSVEDANHGVIRRSSYSPCRRQKFAAWRALTASHDLSAVEARHSVALGESGIVKSVLDEVIVPLKAWRFARCG